MIETIAIEKIAANPKQPREEFDQKSLKTLAASLKGELLQPIGVREVKRAKKPFELIWGERRMRAAELAGWTEITAHVIRAAKADALVMMGEENLTREDWNAIEKARYLDVLSQDRRRGGAGFTDQEIAQRFGKSVSWVRNLKRLLQLPIEWQGRVISAEISERMARALVPYADKADVLEKIALDMQESPWAWTTGEDFERNAALVEENFVIPKKVTPIQKRAVAKAASVKRSTGRASKKFLASILEPYRGNLSVLELLRDLVVSLLDEAKKTA